MDRLIIRYVRDPAGRAAAMEAGDIHIGVFNPVAPPDIKRLTATGKFVATPKGYEEAVWSTSLECNMRNPIFAKREVRQAMFHRRRPQPDRQDGLLRLCAAGHGPDLLAQQGVLHARHLQDRLRSQEGGGAARRRGLSEEGRRQALHAQPAGGRLVRRERQDRRHREAGRWKMSASAINLTVPDRPTSIKRIYTDYDFDLAISNQANPSEPVPSTTQYYTTGRHQEGRALPQRLGLPHRRGRCPGREDQGRDRSRQAQGAGGRIPEDHDVRSAQPAAGRARIDHRRQHQGAEPLQRSQLPGRELDDIWLAS